MEPLRLCQSAQFFMRCDAKLRPNAQSGDFLTPCRDDPPCPHCPMKLSTTNPVDLLRPCHKCGALRMRLYDLPERGFSDEALQPPIVRFEDFNKVLEHSAISVAQEGRS